MPLSRSEVEKIAHLARIEISATEVPGFVENLSRIIDFVRQLEAAETSTVEPMAHPLEAMQRLRQDRVTETDRRELYQRNAARVEAGFYLVPKVID